MAITGEVQIKVKTEELVAKADSVTNYIGKVSTSFESIAAIIKRTENYWIGDAGDLHRKIYNDEKANIEEMFRKMKEHPKDLKAIAGVYTEAENTITNIANELPGDLIV